MKKLKVGLLIAALAATSGVALAADNIWDGSDANWTDTSHWSLGVTPNNADTGRIVGGTVTMNTDNSADSLDQLHVGATSGTADAAMNIETGANLVTDVGIFAGRGGTGTSTITQTGGVVSSTRLKLGTANNSGLSTYNMNGGTLSISSWLEIAPNSGTAGTFNMNSGTVNHASTGGVLGKTGGTGTLNLNNGSFTSSSHIYVGDVSSTATGIINQTGGDHSFYKLQLSDNDSTSLVSISGGSFNVSHYIKSWAANDSATFKVDGSGASSIEIGSLSLVSENFEVNLDSGGSTLVVVDGEGTYHDGLLLTSADFTLGGSGFDDTVGTYYDLAWSVDGIGTNGMAFIDNTGLTGGKSWELSIVSGTHESVSGDYLRATVIPEPATLGMVAVFGGGVLFVRRKFMI